MAINGFESLHFPYLPLTLAVGFRQIEAEALVDTGFDGDVAVPAALVVGGQPPDEFRSWELADGSEVTAPVYYGTVQLPNFTPVQADIVVLGEEPIVGRGITDRYRLILDHGERIIAQP